MPTAPGIPRRSPIQVLTGPEPALLPRSDEIGRSQAATAARTHPPAPLQRSPALPTTLPKHTAASPCPTATPHTHPSPAHLTPLQHLPPDPACELLLHRARLTCRHLTAHALLPLSQHLGQPACPLSTLRSLSALTRPPPSPPFPTRPAEPAPQPGPHPHRACFTPPSPQPPTPSPLLLPPPRPG